VLAGAAVSSMLLASADSLAAVVWNEGVNGDLSTNEAAPTPLAFALGSNTMSGSVFSPNDTRDYFTFTIPAGWTLTHAFLLSYTDVATGGPANTGFHAINAGATSFIPSASTANDFLGGNHLEAFAVGTDLLPGLAAATTNGTGFVAPLGPGTYSFLVQQTSPIASAYSLDFVIEVPAPGAPAGAILGATMLTRRRRR
jgi:hypothetical protein